MVSLPCTIYRRSMAQASKLSPRTLSPFGEQLRLLRKQRGLSQLALSGLAETTPRYVSFVETGRSRPGRSFILRLAQSLDLPLRDRNDLLRAAGFRPEFPEHPLNDAEIAPYRRAVKTILEHHDPYPGCAFDSLGRVLMCNKTFRAFSPDIEKMTPEESIDAFFGAPQMRATIDNWAELAWAWVDGKRAEVAHSNAPQLRALLERALAHLRTVERPPAMNEAQSGVLSPRFRINGQLIETFATVMRFERPREVTLSDLRVELIFPLDDSGDAFFRSLTAAPS